MSPNIKIPYEPPKIIDLGGGTAHADTGDCESGSYASRRCGSGSSAQQYQCRSGSSAGKENCQAGGSPGQQCTSGSVAYGGKCLSGSVAAQTCWAGSVPK